jgi:galactokinase
MDPLLDLEKQFRDLFGATPTLYRAPGRVNLIGEHTDYNGGFVMPAAIDFSCWVAIAPRTDRNLVVRSLNVEQTLEFPLDGTPPADVPKWSNYVTGVARVLEAAGYRLQGANLAIWGNVPLGAGLSSSAAIEVATGYALLDISGVPIDRTQLAKLCQRAENEFVGMRCGIMDQFISCRGRSGKLMMLDCRSLDYRELPLQPGVQLVICNTMVKHQHAGGEYNVRRAQCEEGVRILAKALPGIHALRDVTLPELEQHRELLSDVVYRRCRHVISENERVTQAAVALASADIDCVGRLMAESHRSLRDDYEVSCRELDLMVDLAAKQPGVYGSRMTGGGFGGCTVSLMKEDMTPGFQRVVSHEYQAQTGLRPDIYISAPADGAGRYRQQPSMSTRDAS